MSVMNDFAFPTHFFGQSAAQHGLTKRELFAAMAMQGMLSNKNVMGGDAKEGYALINTTADELGKECAYFADALIKALSEQQP